MKNLLVVLLVLLVSCQEPTLEKRMDRSAVVVDKVADCQGSIELVYHAVLRDFSGNYYDEIVSPEQFYSLQIGDTIHIQKP